MSRSVNECGNYIWRYRAGQEDSIACVSLIYKVGDYKVLELDENYEIVEYTAEEYFFGMKKTIADAYSDVLIIKKEDIDSLKGLYNSLDKNINKELDLFNKSFKDADKYVSFEQMEKDIDFMKENCPNVWFYKMVESMVHYIENNPKEIYYFMGEI